MPSVITPAAGRRPDRPDLSPPERSLFFFTQQKVSAPSLRLLSVFPGPFRQLLGCCAAIKCGHRGSTFVFLASVCTQRPAASQCGTLARSVLILGGPFLRGPCFEADIQTQLRRRTEMDSTLRACGILIPAFAACHAVHSSQLKKRLSDKGHR